MVVVSGEDRESKSFSEAAKKNAPQDGGVRWPGDRATIVPAMSHSILWPINLTPGGGIRGLPSQP
jgi:hypothetical protein